jgi:enamine deaminase RidA (YjgF/YER057c/UK114 family)
LPKIIIGIYLLIARPVAQHRDPRARPQPRARLALATGAPMGEDKMSAERPGITGLSRPSAKLKTENDMAALVDKRLSELGIVLPVPASPIANYVGFVRTGALLVVSGQLCFDAGGKLLAKGKLGGGVSIEDGQKAARACAINLLAQVKVAVGDLDKVVRVVRLGGFINSDPAFLDGPKVMNGASDLVVEVFGDKGRHARTTVGVAALPLDAAVEVEGLFELA